MVYLLRCEKSNRIVKKKYTIESNEIHKYSWLISDENLSTNIDYFKIKERE